MYEWREKKNIASHEKFMNKMPGALADNYIYIIHMKWEWKSPEVKIQRKRKIYKNTDTFILHTIYYTVCTEIICKLTKEKHS